MNSKLSNDTPLNQDKKKTLKKRYFCKKQIVNSIFTIIFKKINFGVINIYLDIAPYHIHIGNYQA